MTGRTDFPRILLLTLRSPTAKYGTGDVIRRLVSCLPKEDIYWAYFKGKKNDRWQSSCVSRIFQVKALHWKLKAGLWQYLFTRLQAKRIAENIGDWVKVFNPALIWVTPGADCIIVARHLQKILKIPVHVTIHDAYEIDRVFMRHSYLYWILRKDIAVLLKNAATIDAVSLELIDHTKREFELSFTKTLVFPPSVEEALSPESIASVPEWKDDVRRIGLCGNPRVEEYQWNNFVGMLGRMPFSFELHVFGNDEIMTQVQYPSNVHMMALGFAETEAEMLEHFRKAEISVCYLGLYREEKQEYFVRTSLSSKLTTYVSAGYPVCVDGPEKSVAWRLVSKYDAGVMVDPDADDNSDFVELLTNKDVWERKSDGALRLCRTEMDLEKNTHKLMELMRAAVASDQ